MKSYDPNNLVMEELPCRMLIGAQGYTVEVLDHEVVFTQDVFKKQVIFSRVSQNGEYVGLWQVRTQDCMGEDQPTYVADVIRMSNLVHATFGEDFTQIREL